MARAIVRVSIDAPPGTGGHQHSQLTKRSLGLPFTENSRTGTVEANGADAGEIFAGLRRLLDHVESNLPEGFGVDHLWIYFDKEPN